MFGRKKDGERTPDGEQTQRGEHRECRVLSEHIEALGRDVETPSVRGGHTSGYRLRQNK